MYTLKILNNGIRLLLAPQEGTEAVTIFVLVKIGSRYESQNLNGVSHFIEHLLFKGTKKRPTSLDITKELDGVGADFNAFTAKDHTGYYVRANHEKIELALEVVSDMLHNSLFSPKEIQKERGVIMEEINLYEDNPLLMIDNVFEEAVFKGSALARSIAGAKENIKNISREEIIRYFKANYASGNVLVAVGGKFNQKKILALAEKLFCSLRKKTSQAVFKKFSSRQNKPQLNLKAKETEQAHLALGFPAYNLTDPRLYPLSLLSVILGGNMSSRLFLEIREKLGLAYYIRTEIGAFEDTGAFSVAAGLDKSKIELAILTIIKEFKKVVSQKVSAEELLRAKEFIKGKLILRLEDSAQRTLWLAIQILLKGKIETLEEQIQKVEAVTAQQIQSIARDIIQTKKINLALIGPVKDKNQLFKIINH